MGEIAYLFGRQIGRVTEAENKHNKLIITPS